MILLLPGTYPNVDVDYEDVLVAEGRIRAIDHPMVELQPDGLRFS